MEFIFAFHQCVDSWTGTQDVKLVLQRLIHTETSCCPASYDFKNSSKFLNWIVSVFSFIHSFPSAICEYQAYPQNYLSIMIDTKVDR